MVKVFGWQLWAKKQKQTKIVLMRVPHTTEQTTCINTTYLEGLLSTETCIERSYVHLSLIQMLKQPLALWLLEL